MVEVDVAMGMVMSQAVERIRRRMSKVRERTWLRLSDGASRSREAGSRSLRRYSDAISHTVRSYLDNASRLSEMSDTTLCALRHAAWHMAAYGEGSRISRPTAAEWPVLSLRARPKLCHYAMDARCFSSILGLQQWT